MAQQNTSLGLEVPQRLRLFATVGADGALIYWKELSAVAATVWASGRLGERASAQRGGALMSRHLENMLTSDCLRRRSGHTFSARPIRPARHGRRADRAREIGRNVEFTIGGQSRMRLKTP
jgi:hypothetical protein